MSAKGWLAAGGIVSVLAFGGLFAVAEKAAEADAAAANVAQPCGPDIVPAVQTGGGSSVEAARDRNAQTWISVGRGLGMPDKGIQIGLATILTESGGLNLASHAVPESLRYPHDVNKLLYPPDGTPPGDHDSIGTAQQRVGGFTWWPSIEQGMKVSVQADAFYRRLDKIVGWETMSFGVAAQRVQVSAYPERYDQHKADALALFARLAGTAPAAVVDASCDSAVIDEAAAVSGQWANPLKPSPYVLTSQFGWRTLRGVLNFHKGQDLAVPVGTHVLAPCSGTVLKLLTPAQSYGAGNETTLDCGGAYHVRLQHQSQFHTTVGAHVKAGEYIGDSGNTGNSTGPHLHVQLEENGTPIDPVPFFAKRGVPF